MPKTNRLHFASDMPSESSIFLSRQELDDIKRHAEETGIEIALRMVARHLHCPIAEIRRAIKREAQAVRQPRPRAKQTQVSP